MPGKILDFDKLLQPESLALAIATKYREWEAYRKPWATQKAELRNYLFATDTTTTSNKTLPWKNSTTTPKLTQIRDNLHANYMAALFPNAEWLEWEGDSEQDETQLKREAIKAYMRTKLRQDRAEVTISKLVLDYIDYGNVFATAKWVDESLKNKQGNVVRGYVGPRIVRISPYDVVFNPTVNEFNETPKIIRAIKTIGELVKEAKEKSNDSVENKLLTKGLEQGLHIRSIVSEHSSQGDVLKSEAFQIDGFSSIQNYYNSGYVEVLTFFGDLYDIQSGELLENHIISIMDRAFVIDKRPFSDWVTSPGVFHAGWRLRPDNLYAQGPLDNLVGMQYRIDHLENLKADVFDLIAVPFQIVKGEVQEYVYEPGGRAFVGDDGSIEFAKPDALALNADTQINELERRMEEMAGAPKEAMGIRTPGEKTKFEVQLLDNAASRLFLNKVMHFEKNFLEPLLNYMLILSRQNMSGQDIARTLDSDIDAVIFSAITKEDLTATGILRPKGASHFAQKANTLQNIVTIMNSAIGQDPAVNVHLSGKKIAKLIEELSDLEKFKLYGDNIRIIESLETQKLTNSAQEQMQIQQVTPPGITEGDVASGPPDQMV